MIFIKYIIIFALLVGFWISEASFGLEKIDDGLIGSDIDGWFIVTVQFYVSLLLWFLYVLAVLVWIWWGFIILTAAWEDEKVTKGRNYIVYMALGLIVIFLAGSIVDLIMGSIFDASWTAPGDSWIIWDDQATSTIF